jgi:predicted Zn-dependent protease
MAFELSKILPQIAVEADWIGLREVRETTTLHFVRKEKPQANDTMTTHGVMVEVMKNGQIGYAATNLLTPAAIQKAAERALKQAEMMANFGVHTFSADVRPKAVGTYTSPFKKPFDAMSAGEINGLLIEITKALNVSDKIINTMALARLVESETRFVSSNGSDLFQKFFFISTDFNVTAQEGSIVQRRSDNGSFARSHQAGLEMLDREIVLQRAKNIGKQAVELLDAAECPTEATNLVLAPDQMLLQIHESIGHPLEIDRILGDERNYAGSSFVKLSDFGTLQYGSQLMNITYDPTVSGEFAAYAFDDAGVPATREYIIKEGLLLRGEGSSESQARANIPGVANFRAQSWNRQPIDRIVNLNLEPGEHSFDEIISSVERGVYMETNRSWSIDDYRNKFQFGCEYGKLIEKGKLTKTLKNCNYRGITTPFWRGLTMVGDRSTWQVFGTPYCGKGEPNQIMRVGHASPVALFGNIEVFGGA